MSDSDDNKPVPKKPQPRPRSKRSKVAHSTSAASATSLPNSTLSPSQKENSTGFLTHTDNERVEDEFFNRANVSFREIHQMQENIMHQKLIKQDDELDLQDLNTPAVEVLPILDFEEEAEAVKKDKNVSQKKSEALNEKRKRELSLTPPPELPARRYPIFASSARTSSTASMAVIDLDEDEDDDLEKVNELDPELASIAAKLHTVASQQSLEGTSPLSPESSLSQPLANSPLPQSQSSQLSPSIPTATAAAISSSQDATTGSPNQQPSTPSNSSTILLVIRMNRHPLLVVLPENADAQKALERPVQVTVRSTNIFKEMMAFYCNQKGISYRDTVFTYLGTRLMPSSTPAALDFPPRVIIEAYDQNTYKYMKEQEHLERARKLAEMERLAAEAAAAAAPESQYPSQQQAHELYEGGGGDDETSVEYVHIKLRGKDTSDEKIRVKKRYPAEAVVRLEFDDEVLDSTTIIGHTEIEDDDMLFVRVG
ncbi:hypothetical protein FBU30_002825 [Linnemannia zychae]|nr:hypothetical protein FBU30_002825 [Linnemannia zychae]